MWSLFSKLKSKTPEDYSELSVQWGAGEPWYGPIPFDYLLSRYKKNPPRVGKFDGDPRKYSYKEIIKLVNKLLASQEQKKELEKLKVEFDSKNILFCDAYNMILEEKDRRNKARKSKIEENKKKPAKAKELKELSDFGVTYNVGITSGEARILIKRHKELLEITQWLDFLKKRGLEALCTISPSYILDNEKGLCHTSLYHFVDSIQEHEKLKIEIDYPTSLNEETFLDFSRLLEDSLEDSLNYLEELKEKYIMIGEKDYIVKGRLPSADQKKFRKEVIQKILNKHWNENRDLKGLILSSFPDLKLVEEKF